MSGFASAAAGLRHVFVRGLVLAAHIGVHPHEQGAPSATKGSGAQMTEQELRKRLELLKTEHRDLDAAINALSEAARGSASADMLQIARLKKRKLRLKDQIAIIEDTLLPDIIA